MARNALLQQTRNEQIWRMYAQLLEKEVNGKRMYTHDCILELVSQRYHLAPKTIMGIVKQVK